jgi:hypothetical protein
MPPAMNIAKLLLLQRQTVRAQQLQLLLAGRGDDAGLRSSLAGAGSTRAAQRGVLGCTAPLSGVGASSIITSAAVSPKTGRRLLFAVTTAGASSATAFRFRGGRL